jgi:hypothetical protein
VRGSCLITSSFKKGSENVNYSLSIAFDRWASKQQKISVE